MNTNRNVKLLIPILVIVWAIGLTFALLQEHKSSSASSNRFAWVPSYPGAQIEQISTVQKGNELRYGYHFQVKDEGSKVREFYERNLKSAGFTVIGKGGVKGESWDLYAENPDRTRSIDINGNAQPEGVIVGVMAVVR